jgi:hypothetical protein
VPYPQRAGDSITRVHRVAELQSDKVTASALAVDCEVEHRQFADRMFQIEPNPNGTDFPGFQGRLAANEPALGAGWTMCAMNRLFGE